MIYIEPLLKPVELEIQHCVFLAREDQVEYLRFMMPNKTDPARCHNLDLLEGGEFYPGKRYRKIKRIQFCKTGICKKKSLSPDSRSETKTTIEDRNGNNESNCIHDH